MIRPRTRIGRILASRREFIRAMGGIYSTNWRHAFALRMGASASRSDATPAPEAAHG